LADKAETTTKNLFILYEVPLPGSAPRTNTLSGPGDCQSKAATAAGRVSYTLW